MLVRWQRWMAPGKMNGDPCRKLSNRPRMMESASSGLTVKPASELHGELLESLKGFSRVHIDCSELKSADYYVLQLLCSAHLASIAWIKEVCFHGKPSGALRNAAASVGLLRRNKCSICPDDVHCLWSEL